MKLDEIRQSEEIKHIKDLSSLETGAMELLKGTKYVIDIEAMKSFMKEGDAAVLLTVGGPHTRHSGGGSVSGYWIDTQILYVDETIYLLPAKSFLGPNPKHMQKCTINFIDLKLRKDTKKMQLTGEHISPERFRERYLEHVDRLEADIKADIKRLKRVGTVCTVTALAVAAALCGSLKSCMDSQDAPSTPEIGLQFED